MKPMTFVGTIFFFSEFLLLTSPNKLLVKSTASPPKAFTNETDRQALVAIKGQINSDPFQVLDSWNASLHFCRWQGVNCSHTHQRVTSLKLASLRLAGTLSPHIGNLSFLREIDLGDNNFYGIIPQDIGRLPRLRQLLLWNNSFGGEIPTNLTQCSRLATIVLNSNQLIGEIPTSFGSFPNLNELSLSANYLTGSIPPSLGNLSYLTILGLARNNLVGSIPDELARLANIQFLQLAINRLSGEVPTGLYNSSSLYMLSVTTNLLHGKLPPDLGLTLPNLQRIHVGGNLFSGPIPNSLANASALTQFSIPNNSFTGPLPMNLGTLRYLESLKLSDNPLFAMSANDKNLEFFASLTNCTNLMFLQASRTKLTGAFPDSVANLSKLNILLLDQNSLSGRIPRGIENLVNLLSLALDYNNLAGTIPDSIGNLIKLQGLDISRNKFWGTIPDSIGNITTLSLLDISENTLEGEIPASLGNCSFLQGLVLSSNNLTGVVPKQVLGLSSLSTVLDLSRNYLNGTLSPELGSLKNLQKLDVSKNQLSGEIPNTLGSCLMLEYLYLGDNLFEGTIPSSLQHLRSMQVLDLSHNNLSGQIPEFLGNFSYLTTLNLSFNDFEGQVPNRGIFMNVSAFSIVGNRRLCGGDQKLMLPPCPISSNSHRNRNYLTEILLPAIGGIAILLLLVLMYRRRLPTREIPFSSMPVVNQYLDLSYGEIARATNMFSSRNLIGRGSFGSVYKGTLDPGGLHIAVKVFNLNVHGANKSFLAECEALKNIRHRNLVKILSCCSSMDFKGNDFKALVYEFMPNGNLDSWLHLDSLVSHESESLQSLKLIQRLSIAIDVANALEYLHHHCQEQVVHCDLKPSNILLDGDLIAHVGDFGLAKLLLATTPPSSGSQTSSVGLRGTVGYVAPDKTLTSIYYLWLLVLFNFCNVFITSFRNHIDLRTKEAPQFPCAFVAEYGMSREVSTQGDVYSFGIVLLELFTGKRPTDGMFSDNLSLCSFVEMALLNGQVLPIIDPRLMLTEEPHIIFGDGTSRSHKIKECLSLILRIGVTCSAESPRERMDLRDALKELHIAKKLLVS